MLWWDCFVKIKKKKKDPWWELQRSSLVVNEHSKWPLLNHFCTVRHVIYVFSLFISVWITQHIMDECAWKFCGTTIALVWWVLACVYIYCYICYCSDLCSASSVRVLAASIRRWSTVAGGVERDVELEDNSTLASSSKLVVIAGEQLY